MPPSIEAELTTHAAALRGLARVLTREQDVDDVVQDTVLHALASPPPRSLRAWLFGILRHRASKQRRTARRRERREAAVVAPAPVLTPPELVARKEMLHRLHAALMALPEPYLGTLLLRFFEDLSAAAIAARTGAPLPTVKSRLARGLRLLRERLEHSGGDWRAALGAAFGVERIAVGAVTRGVVIMGTAVKIVLGGVAAALALTAWLSWGAPLAMPPPTGGPIADTFESTPAHGNAPPASARQRHRVAVAVSTVATNVWLHGRCIDVAGQPLAGCEVRLRAVRGNADRVAAWQREHGAFAWDDPRPVTTGAGGAFALHVPASGPLTTELSASAPGRALATARWPELVAGVDLDVGDVRLHRLVQVHLRAVDARRDPVPDTAVTFHLAGAGRDADEVATPPRWTTVHTDGAGRATVMLAEGEHSVLSSLVNEGPGRKLRVPGDRSSFDAELELRGLPAVARIRGVVTAEDGAPLANVIIRAGRTPDAGPYRTRTDADGRFVLGRPADFPEDPVFLRCSAEGCDVAMPSEPVAWGTHGVVVVMRRGAAVVLRVRRPDGMPVESYRVVVWGAVARYPSIDRRGRHPRGEVVLDPLPRNEHQVSVVPDDPALAGRYCQRFSGGERGPTLVDIVLPPSAARTLRVVAADGTPVADARYELIDPRAHNRPDLDTTVVAFDEWQHIAGDNLALLIASGRTDARGEATLRGERDRPFAVRLPGGPHLPFIAHDVALGETAPLVLTVRRGASVHGRLGPDQLLAGLRQATDWQHLDNWPEAFSEPSLHVAMHSVDGKGTRRTASVAADGTFTVGGLPAGNWKLVLVAECNGPGLGTLRHDLAQIELAADTDLERSFDLRELTPARVRGTARVDGALAAGGRLFVGDYGATVGADGSFEVWVVPGPQPTRARIGFGATPFWFPDVPQIAPGATVECALSLHTGLLRARLVDQERRPVVTEVTIADAGGRFRASCPADADGGVGQRVDAGVFVLTAWPRSLQTEDARSRFAAAHAGDVDALMRQRVVLGTVTVTAGDEAWQTIVVPAEWDR